MNGLMRFYNQKRYIIWLFALILIAIIVLIQIINGFVSKREIQISNSDKNTVRTDIDNNYSIITKEEVKEEISQIIEEFLDYCNNKEIEKAYELLSNECKKVLYPTLEDFANKYYYKLFNEKRNYIKQAWIRDGKRVIYKVDFVEDMLATGTAANTSISDYYTVINNNDKYELNINKFIGTEDISKSETKNNITIKINKKRIYMDYEIYELEIKNNSRYGIMLDSLENSNTVYLEDENNQNYYWYKTEILEEDIILRKAQGRTIEIRFNKEYKPTKKVKKIIFSNIIINQQDKLEFEILL